jgi:glutathione S-transferase
MKLCYAPGACSLAPHLGAHEAGLPVKLVKVHLFRHTLDDGSDYRAVNPRGYVPLIELDDGARITEAAILVQYLADKGHNAELLPTAATPERLKVQSWLNFVATELHKTFSPWLWHKETADSAKAAVRAKLAERFAEIDRLLAGQSYLTGERFTVADAYAFTIINWSDFFDIDLKPYPNLSAFMDRVAVRPAVTDALRAEGLLKASA